MGENPIHKQVWPWILILTNVVLGYFLWRAEFSDSRQFIKKYPLLSKRLAVENHNDILLDFEALRQGIKSYLKETGVEYGFYFEYLPSGVSIRSGDEAPFVAASLMKIPTVMDLFRLAEKGQVNLDQPITVTEEHITEQGEFGNITNLRPGMKITPREAAKLALTLSDNTATVLIASLLQKVPVEDDVFHSLDLPVDEKPDQSIGALLNIRNYSSIIKCLYFSCFLSPKYSQEILEFLSESKNRNRLPSGVPDTIPVANKIGVFNKESQSDCAIVYEPNRPYLICMMMASTDSETIDRHFQKISKMTYTYVHGIRKNF